MKRSRGIFTTGETKKSVQKSTMDVLQIVAVHIMRRVRESSGRQPIAMFNFHGRFFMMSPVTASKIS